MRVAPEIILTSKERAELMRLVRSRLTSVRLEQRAGIVLLAADGFQNKDVAQMLSIDVSKFPAGGSAMANIVWPVSSTTCHAVHPR